MQIIREETPLWSRQLRQTLVRGLDTKYYIVSSIKYYSFDVIDGRPNYEVSVTEVDEKGNFRVLVQPHKKTFVEKDPAVRHHALVLDTFDALLRLQVPEPPKVPAHAPAPGPQAGTPAPAAQSPKSSGAAPLPKSSAGQAPKSSGAQAPKSSGAQAPKSSSAQAPKSSSAPPADAAKP